MTNNTSFPIIAETQRLILRQFCQSDIDSLSEILADPDVMRFSLNGPYSFEQTQKLLEGTISSYAQNGLGLWAAVLKDSNRLIGYCGHFIHHIDNQREIELSYRLAKACWNKGLATEAAKATCQYAFAQRGLDRLISIIAPENTASIRVAKKCGMTFEKTSTFHNIPVHIYAANQHSR